MTITPRPEVQSVIYLSAHKHRSKTITEDHDSHISIAMPDGTTCRAYIPFQVYSTDEGGQIVRLEFAAFGAMGLIIEAHLDPAGDTAKTLELIAHSPARTVLTSLPHLDLSAMRIK